MNQNIWGSSMWFSLHTITMNYPNNPTYIDAEEYKKFFTSLKNIIPCKVCKDNYKRHLKEYPIENHLYNKKTLVYWLIDIHNMVNSEIGKKVISYEKVIEKYERIYNKKILEDNELIRREYKIEYKNKRKNNTELLFLLLSIVIILGIIYYYESKKKK